MNFFYHYFISSKYRINQYCITICIIELLLLLIIFVLLFVIFNYNLLFQDFFKDKLSRLFKELLFLDT